MSVHSIKKLDEILRLPGRILHHKVDRLTSPGENYGSLMLSVVITIETPTGNKDVYVVAKTVPPNEFIQQVFNTPVTFRNEIAFYKNIVPLLQNFQKENGIEKVIDFTPTYYGSRLNLIGTDKVDDDAILVLENLKVEDFKTLESAEGLDYDVAELVLKDLADLHAVSLGLKLKNPELFEKRIKPYLEPWMPKERNHNVLKQAVSRLIEETPELHPWKNRILTGFDKQMVLHEPHEPFATISHNDCWTNNIMVKFSNKKPIKTKLVDYQVCSYGSPARDLVFFLFASVKSHVIEKNYDNLLMIYHERFLSILKDVGCDTKPFTFEALQEEIKTEAKPQFGHISFMFFPIFAEKTKIKDISELSPENMIPDGFTAAHKEKFVFVVKEFVKRNWI